MHYSFYLDETDTHGPAPTIIMAGYLGHDYQWRRFDVKLARLQAQYGFRNFHAHEFDAKRNEFAGWSDRKCLDLVTDIGELARANLTEGMAVSLEHARYMGEYRAPPIPKKMLLDSQYGVCFRACLARLFDVMEARNHRDTVDVIVESGHKNAGDCQRIFNDLKRRFDHLGIPALGTFSTASKAAAPRLMIADFLASAHSKGRAAIARGEADPQVAAPLPAKISGRLAFLELMPDALVNLKLGFEKVRDLEIAEWRARRPPRSTK
ncbi:MAG: hypothetical protein J0H42_18355 [Rhizobiales bacterium]|nr:hypothetical protein [Hyphomicrobiales bacterium]